MDGELTQYDGVAFTTRGDVAIAVYEKSARLLRSRWLFDQLDRAVASHPQGMIGLMLVLPSAGPPDAPTRTENVLRLRRLGPKLRRLVTIPVGEAVHQMVVRAVMRALAILHGQGRSHFICSDISEGLSRVLDGASERTPSRSQLAADLIALQDALGTVALPAQEREPGVARNRFEKEPPFADAHRIPRGSQTNIVQTTSAPSGSFAGLGSSTPIPSK